MQSISNVCPFKPQNKQTHTHTHEWIKPQLVSISLFRLIENWFASIIQIMIFGKLLLMLLLL